MRIVEPVVSIGLGNIHGVSADLIISKDDRLVLRQHEDMINIDLCIGRATKGRIDFIIECLQSIRLHASDD